VLVAEDEEQLLVLCGRVLGKRGYEVLPAGNGDEALRIFAQRRDDIRAVVIDATIPPRGAARVLEKISQMRDDIGVVVTSGDELDVPLRELLVANEGIFLRKPFPAIALVHAVEDSQMREVP
jgi:two-component system cell cycle sensor histidine kinase/response regulator CckA